MQMIVLHACSLCLSDGLTFFAWAYKDRTDFILSPLRIFHGATASKPKYKEKYSQMRKVKTGGGALVKI